MAWITKLAAAIMEGAVIGFYRGRAIVRRWQKEPDATDEDRRTVSRAWALYDELRSGESGYEPHAAPRHGEGSDDVGSGGAPRDGGGRDARARVERFINRAAEGADRDGG